MTGGAGFLGQHLALALVARGWHVRVLDLRAPVAHLPVEWVQGDVRDARAMEEAAEGVDVIFHLAATVGVDRLLQDPLESIDIVVNGTRNALEAAAAVGAALVHMSTSEVLGLNPSLPWDEGAERALGSATVDRWSYAASKATAEHVVVAGARARGIAATVVRPFNVYGPGQEARFVIPRMAQAALRGEPITVFEPGDQTRCFTFIDDVIEGILLSARHAGAVPVVHLGSTREISMLELAATIIRIVGSDAAVRLVDPATHFGSGFVDMKRRLPDSSLARDVLGWTATTGLEDGLARTVDWSRDVERARAPV